MKSVLFDAEFLSLLLFPEAKPPNDPKTGKPVTRCKERIEHLIETLDAGRIKILIPAPALAEFLVLVEESAEDYLRELLSQSVFNMAAFDTRAAIETAELHRKAIKGGDKRGGVVQAWQKVKIDRQIVAIAIANGCTRIYSADGDIIKLANGADIDVSDVSDLPLPPSKDRPLPLALDGPKASAPPSDSATTEK